MAITGQRDLRRRAIPPSTNLPHPPVGPSIPSDTSAINQVAIMLPQGPPVIDHMVVAPPTTPLNEEQHKRIVSDAKNRLQHMILCEIPFPSKLEMQTHATHALEASIDIVLQGLEVY